MTAANLPPDTSRPGDVPGPAPDGDRRAVPGRPLLLRDVALVFLVSGLVAVLLTTGFLMFGSPD